MVKTCLPFVKEQGYYTIFRSWYASGEIRKRFDLHQYGGGVDGKTIRIITRPGERGNVYAGLLERTILGEGNVKTWPPRKPPAEVVGAARKGGDLLADDNDIVSNSQSKSQVSPQEGG